MSMRSIPFRLPGIVPPLATPFRASGSLDECALARLVDHVLGGGVHGLFVLGTTGEGPSLSPEVSATVVQRVCAQVAGRVPVLVSVTHTCAAQVESMADVARENGASALVLASPYYFQMSQDELYDYLERMVPRLPLPVFLYNIPSCTSLEYSVGLLKRAAHLPNLAGLKDSSGDMKYFAEARAALPARDGFTVLCGPEELLPESMALGGDGGVNGGANLFPRLYVRLYDACRAGDAPKIAELHRCVMEISRRVYAAAGGSSSYLRGLKTALHCAGLCENTLAEPFRPLSGREQDQVEAAVRDLQSRPTMAA